MKFNLTNRPTDEKLKEKWFDDRDSEYREKAEEWFEGFEKELREIVDHIEQIEKQHGGKTIRNSAKYDLIKEILGE